MLIIALITLLCIASIATGTVLLFKKDNIIAFAICGAISVYLSMFAAWYGTSHASKGHHYHTTHGIVEKVEPSHEGFLFHFKDGRVVNFNDSNRNLNLIIGKPYEIIYNPQSGNQIIKIERLSMSEWTSPFIRINQE